MTEHVYKTLELTGSSEKGFEPATQRAISNAHESV
ncbi:dodecin domain-containing protein [Variovorax sp. E3]|nr:dodecin domain-containing protein [Variovorax sp. E3]